MHLNSHLHFPLCSSSLCIFFNLKILYMTWKICLWDSEFCLGTQYFMPCTFRVSSCIHEIMHALYWYTWKILVWFEHNTRTRKRRHDCQGLYILNHVNELGRYNNILKYPTAHDRLLGDQLCRLGKYHWYRILLIYKNTLHMFSCLTSQA